MAETTPRREATRLKLIEAGIAQFGSHGIDATSVEQLCEAAGFSRGAFYSNFSSKDELCLAIARYIIDQQLNEFVKATEAMQGQIEIGEAVRHILAAHHCTSYHHLFMLELELRARRDPEFSRLLAQTQCDLIQRFEAVLQRSAELSRVEFLIPIEDLMHILNALFTYSAFPREEDLARSTHLIGLIAQHLTCPKELQ